MKIELFYDKECPFCNSYANYLKLKEEHELILLNAREQKENIEKFKVLGFDINNGYIIRLDGKKIYQGADAILYLNNLSSTKVFFKDNIFFRNIIYPIIKLGRVIALKISKKKYKL